MTFLHLCNAGSTNIGNGALISGTERVLREDCQAPVDFTREPWDDYTARAEAKSFEVDLLKRIETGGNAFLVGAAVTMDGSERYGSSGWRVDLPPSKWATIKKPLIFYGLSYRSWPDRPYAHREKLKETLRTLLDLPNCIFSVRLDGTKAWIEETIGIASDRIIEIPDPALYVETRETFHATIDPKRKNILVALNGEDSDYRFGVGVPRRWRGWGGRKEPVKLMHEKERRHRVLRGVAGALAKIEKEFDANIILCPHYYDDYKMITELIRVSSMRLAHQVFVCNDLPKATQHAAFYDIYAKADLAISMRIHSMTPSLGLGTPTIVLSTEARSRAIMKNAELDDYGLDAFAPDLGGRLADLARATLNDPVPVRKRIASKITAWREQTRQFNQRIDGMLTKS